MKRPLISAIVPCYNVAGLVDRCIRSIVDQTIGLESIEIILVNDASTDDTLERLLAWERRYPKQIMVITYEENLRQGGARNIGICYASSDYVSFIDADDWIEPDMFETLYDRSNEGHFDVVKGKHIRKTVLEKSYSSNSFRDDQIKQFEKRGSFYGGDIGFVGNNGEFGRTDGLYKRKLIIDNDIWFPEKTAYEDNYWSMILRLYIKNMYIVDKVLYHYMINEVSTTTAKNASHHLDRMYVEVAVIEEYKKRGAYEYFKPELCRNFIQMFYLNTLYILFTRFDCIPDIFGYMKDMVNKYAPDYKDYLDVDNLTPREKQLLRLLDIEGEVTVEMMERIRKAYLSPG